MTIRRSVERWALALGLAIALAAVAPTPARADVHEVLVVDFEFIPNDITIRLGDTVIFSWIEDYHSVTSFNGLFDSGIQYTGYSFDVTFPVAGVFPYFCKPHMDMLGTIRVQKSGVPQSIWWYPRP